MNSTPLIKQLLLLCFVALSLSAYAQSGSITGRITDETGQALLGATVFVKGGNQNGIADADGNFRLPAVGNGTITLVARMIGYQLIERTVTVNNGTVSVDIRLTSDTRGLNEVVVVGYGTQKKSDLTGSITAISSKDFNKGAITTPEQLITGKVPGVQITSNGGAPGAGSRIRIRSGSSLNANNDPLIVIDGVPLDNSQVIGVASPLSFINPNDIETFNILKDASATAIYGSRASNGVIIITTKKGVKGDKLHFSFNTQASLSQRTGSVDVLSADQFRKVVNERGNDAQKALLGNASTNWQDVIYREAFATDNHLSVSGSLKSLPFRLSLGYLHQDGILKTSNIKRTTVGLNLSPRLLNDHLKIDINVKGILTKTRFGDQQAINSAVAFDPTQPVYANDSARKALGGYFTWLDPTNNYTTPYPMGTRNPLSMLELKRDLSDQKRSIGNIQLDYKFHFLPDLRANLNLGYDVLRTEGDVFTPAYAENVYFRGGEKRKYEQKKSNKLMDFYLNYVKDLKRAHSRIDITAGYSYQDFIREEPAFPDLHADGTEYIAASIPLKTQNTLVSFFGRVNYSFMDRYLLTGTVRRDGSSRFNSDNRWGTFPSAAFAWRISQEPFLQHAKGLSDLKLRLGYGVTGQQDVGPLGDYPYLARYTISDSAAMYQFGDKYYQTLRPEGYDINIKWEQTETYNAGIDFGFWDGRLSGSVDFYFKRTKNLLSVIPVAAGSNLTNELLTNVGNIENKGVELTLSANPVQTTDFNLDLGFNVTYNQSEITNLTKATNANFIGVLVGDIAGGTGNKVQIHSVGYAPYSFYAYKQVYDQSGKPVEGLYEDLNKDGVIDFNDKYRYKQPDPRVFLGFSSNLAYKAWSLGFVLRANIGNYMYNNFNSANGAYRAFKYAGYLANVSSNVLESNFNEFQLNTDYYVENASFLRMDNINLGYDLSRLLKDKLRMRVSATVQNAFVITKYSGLDPEIPGGIDNKFYPRPRVYTLGVNLDF